MCPSSVPFLINRYHSSAEFLVNGEPILSQEGTTQGDPLTMAVYPIGTLTFIRAVSTNGANQICYTDDAAAGGSLVQLRTWWNELTEKSPVSGYHVNNVKSWLVAAFTHALSNYWAFLLRTVERIAVLFPPLVDAIHLHFFPSLTGCAVPCNVERDLLALPACLGGPGITNPMTMSEEYVHTLHLF